MLWLFGEGVISDCERFRKGVSILKVSLNVVMGAFSKYIDLLIAFAGRYDPYCWLRAILLTGPM